MTRIKTRNGIAIAGVALSAAVVVAYVAMPRGASAGRGGELDDGADLLPRAGITLDAAIAAAQAGRSGAIGEVDLEEWNGTLVFNVDVGDEDVKVDAATGEVLAAERDD